MLLRVPIFHTGSSANHVKNLGQCDHLPTYLKNHPRNAGVVNIPMQSKFQSHASLDLKLRGRGWKADAPVLSNWASKLELSCKANKYSDTETGDLDVLTTHETWLMELPPTAAKILRWLIPYSTNKPAFAYMVWKFRVKKITVKIGLANLKKGCGQSARLNNSGFRWSLRLWLMACHA